MNDAATTRTIARSEQAIMMATRGIRILQRACACGQHTGSAGECEECKKKHEGRLQRAAVDSAPVNEVPPIVHEVLRSSGQPLDAGTRAFLEPRFGHNFSSVRLHTDAKAAESTRAVNALAYTVGHDVVFGVGQYEPHNKTGQRLLFHELTHVLQQSQASPAGNLSLASPHSLHEHEAATAAAVIESGSSPTITRTTAALQRQPARPITAPIPRGATVNRQGQATFQINGITVIAEPDRTSTAQTMRNKAETRFGLVLDAEPGGQYDSRTNTIVSVTPPQIHATVFTTFGPGYDPRKSSTYGRGTTAEDRRAGNTSLGFHESRHGAEWFEFLRQNAAPVFGGRAGMSLDEFNNAREQFHREIDAYNRRAQDYTQRLTDCTGTLPKERELAAFCRQQKQ